MKVYLDGTFADADRAEISAFDAAVQHGVGLFETMRAYHGRVFRVEAHVERLIDSAAQLGLTDRLRPGPLREAVEATLRENKLTDARIRLTVTGGDLALLSAVQNQHSKTESPTDHQPTILISATDPAVYPESFFTDGVPVVVADPKANPFDPTAGHKTLNYWLRLRTLTAAAGAGAGEALWFTVTNHLAGGAVSNAFLVKDDQLLTPIARGEEPKGAIASPVLPGITRSAVIEAAERLDLPVHKKMLTIHDVLEADEVMLTNTGWGILPVIRVEKETIGDGTVGPITRRCYDELLETIRAECADGGDDGP